MFFRSLTEITLQSNYEITSKCKFWNQNMQFWYLHLPAYSVLLANHIALPGREIPGASRVITLPKGHHPALCKVARPPRRPPARQPWRPPALAPATRRPPPPTARPTARYPKRRLLETFNFFCCYNFFGLFIFSFECK